MSGILTIRLGYLHVKHGNELLLLHPNDVIGAPLPNNTVQFDKVKIGNFMYAKLKS